MIKSLSHRLESQTESIVYHIIVSLVEDLTFLTVEELAYIQTQFNTERLIYWPGFLAVTTAINETTDESPIA